MALADYLSTLIQDEAEAKGAPSELERMGRMERTGDFCYELGHVIDARRFWMYALKAAYDYDFSDLSRQLRDKARQLAVKADLAWHRKVPERRGTSFYKDVEEAYEDIFRRITGNV